MTIPAGDILADTEVAAVDGVPGRYVGAIPEAWRIFYAFGGATMATALRAAVAEIDRDDLRLVSADATFCQAVPVGPVAAQVEVLRQGRTGAQALVRLWALDPESPDPTGPARADLVLTVVVGSPSAWSGELAGRRPRTSRTPSSAPSAPSRSTRRSPASRTTPRPTSV